MEEKKEDPKVPTIPYVKLFNQGLEISMPDTLALNEKSKQLLKKGQKEQGFIYYIHLDTQEIDILAATNPKENSAPPSVQPAVQPPQEELSPEEKEIFNSFNQKASRLDILRELKAKTSTMEEAKSQGIEAEWEAREKETNQLQSELDDLEPMYLSIQRKRRKVIPKKLPAAADTALIPIDRFGHAYAANEYATSSFAKTSQTGGTGGGNLHVNGARVLQLGEEDKLLAGGFWIRWEVEGEQLTFMDFRTRSTQNTKLIMFNPIYKVYFNKMMPPGDKVGHTQIYAREIPMVYLKPIVNAFMDASKEIYQDSQKKKEKDSANENQLMTSLRNSLSFDTGSAIPESTRYHLRIESHWPSELTPRFLASFCPFLSITESEALLKGYFDKNFRENLSALKHLFKYINPDNSEASVQGAFAEHARNFMATYCSDIDKLKTLVPPGTELPDPELFYYALHTNQVAAMHYLLDNNFLAKSFANSEEAFSLFTEAMSKGQLDIAKKIIAKSPTINTERRLENGDSILHLYMRIGHPDPEVVNRLSLDKQVWASNNRKDETPLLIAIRKKSFALLGPILETPGVIESHSLEQLIQIMKILREYKQDGLIQKFNSNPELKKTINDIIDDRLKKLTTWLAEMIEQGDVNGIGTWATQLRNEFPSALTSFVEKYVPECDVLYLKAKKEINKENKKDQYEQVLKKYHYVLILDPKNAQALIGQGRIYYELGNYTAAARSYENLDPALFGRDEIQRDYKSALIQEARLELLSVLSKPQQKNPRLTQALKTLQRFFNEEKQDPELSRMLHDILKEIHMAKLTHSQKAHLESKEFFKNLQQGLVDQLESFLKPKKINWTTIEKIKNEILSKKWGIKKEDSKFITIDQYGTQILVPNSVAAMWAALNESKSDGEALQNVQKIANSGLRLKLELFGRSLGRSKESKELDDFYRKFKGNGEYAIKQVPEKGPDINP